LTQNPLAKTLFAFVLPVSVRHSVRRNTFNSEHSTTEGGNPQEKPLKSPIPTGRWWKMKEGKPGYLTPDDVENPFAGKGLPYSKRIIFENQMEEQLAEGKYWINDTDRFGKYADYDLIERGWGDNDLYKSYAFKRSFEDVTGDHNDIDYQFFISNMEMHLAMAKHIPHLAPLVPELTQEFEQLTKPWQQMVDEALFKKMEEKVDEVKSEHVNYHGEKVTTSSQHSVELSRKTEIKKQITKETIRQIVDDSVEHREFVRLIFIDAQGTKHYVYGMVGETLLQCCRRFAVPIDGLCNGYDRGILRVYGTGGWCGTCQMDISPNYFHLIPPFDFREQSLSMGYRTITPTSRLGCCIWIRPEFDGMVVNIPVSMYQPYGGFRHWD